MTRPSFFSPFHQWQGMVYRVGSESVEYVAPDQGHLTCLREITVRLQHRTLIVSSVVALSAATVVLSGCGPTLSASAGTAGVHSEASILTSPTTGSVNVGVDEPVVITADDGRLTSVSVSSDAGVLNGSLNADGTVWTSAPGEKLPFAATVRVNAAAVDSDGRPTEVVDSFTTLTPENTLKTTVRYMSEGGTYGVGMPLALAFNTEVSDRKAVEENLKLTTSQPVTGAWSWNQTGTRVTFRPETYWPANTAVTLNANLYGIKVNENTWATQDTQFSFNIGSAVSLDVNAQTLQMVVSKDGAVIATYPVTTGKPGSETREGIKVISGKEGTIIMDAATLGTSRNSPDYYRLEVDYAMRLTDSGEFIHSAPWSVASQGRANVSNGCIGLSTANAGALWSVTKPGDVVVVSGTGRPTDLGNGITVWNEPWSQWVSNSALGVQTVGPNGSTPAAV